MSRSLLINIEICFYFPYNEGIALLNFSSPCTLLYPFGYMLSEVGQDAIERYSTKDCNCSKSFNFPCLHAGRKTGLAQKLEEKTVHVLCVQKKLIGFGNTFVKAYKYVGLFCVTSKRAGLFIYMN